VLPGLLPARQQLLSHANQHVMVPLLSVLQENASKVVQSTVGSAKSSTV
jgi:hypothetical protein